MCAIRFHVNTHRVCFNNNNNNNNKYEFKTEINHNERKPYFDDARSQTEVLNIYVCTNINQCNAYFPDAQLDIYVCVCCVWKGIYT